MASIGFQCIDAIAKWHIGLHWVEIVGDKSNNSNIPAEIRFGSTALRNRQKDRIAETRLGREEGQGDAEMKREGNIKSSFYLSPLCSPCLCGAIFHIAEKGNGEEKGKSREPRGWALRNGTED